MGRRRLLGPIALAWLCVLGLAACSAGPAARPSLLLISVDTLRADALACYRDGAPGADLCGLFDDGTRYVWAFSTAPYTAPAVASLLTSRYPAYHGLSQTVTSALRDDVATLAERLREAGYATAAFVSNPVLHAGRNLGQGFDVYDARMTRRELNRPGFAEREAGATTDAALRWVRGRARAPWFLWVHYQDPHGPYLPPDAEDAPGDAPDAPRLPVLDDPSGRGGIPSYQALPGLFSADAYRARYRAEIAYLSREVVRLVRGVEASGDRPDLLLTADHGEAFGEDGYWFAHGHSLGMDQVRVPLLFRRAEGGGPRVVATPVSLIDVAPTLLARAGVDPPPGFQGRPLPGAVDDPSPEAPRALYAEHDRRGAVIAEGRFYARNRDADDAGDAPRRSPPGSLGGPDQDLAALPPRVVDLGEETSGYRPPDAGDVPLEQRLTGFLDRTRERRGGTHREVPDAVREQMRALGYVVDEDREAE